MKLEIKNKRLYFVKYSEMEYNWVFQKLNWFEPHKNINESLLFLDEKNQIYTFWGLYKTIKEQANFPVEIKPLERKKERKLTVDENILPGIKLRDYQIMGGNKALLHKEGIISVPTAGGKSLIILAILRKLINENILKNGLIVVPTVGLASQFLKDAIKAGFSNEEIGLYHGKIKEKNKRLLIGVVNTVTKNEPFINEFIQGCNVLIIDEVQHLRSTSYANIAFKAINVEYLLGFSGSPFHGFNVLENPGDSLIQGITGGLIFYVSFKTLVKLGHIAEPVFLFKSTSGPLIKHRMKYKNVEKNYIVNNHDRNNFILQTSSLFVSWNFQVLILVRLKEHGMFFMEHFKGLKVIFVTGGEGSFQYNEFGQIEEVTINYDTVREDYENGKWDIMIATQVFNEGINIPAVGLVVLGCAGKSRIEFSQRLGRGARKKKHINRVYVLDFKDNSHIYLLAQYKTRKKYAEEMEAIILEDEFIFKNAAYQHFLKLREIVGFEIPGLKDCKKCKLFITRINIVPGSGNVNADIMLIGEAPGMNEDKEGKVFVGRSGKLLDEILSKIGINRNDLYITNMVMCRPPENRKPEIDELQACWNHLCFQIGQVRPTKIVTLGATASQTILNTDMKISDLRGNVYDWQGIKVFPVFHSSYVLRNPENLGLFYQDLLRIKK